MSRVATIPLQRTMADAIQRSQQALAASQEQLASGKKAPDYASLGTETVRNLSSHSLLSRQQAESAVAKRIGTTLKLYDSHLGGIESAANDLRTQLLTAVGTGEAAGVQDAIESAFHQFATSLNADEGGTPLFGGSQSGGDPFKPAELSELAGLDASQAFANDGVRASARVAEGVDVVYGIGASDIGTGLYAAFRTLAEGGAVGTTLTDAQKATLTQAASQLGQGLETLRAVNANNGRNQTVVETLATRGDERALVLQDVIGDNEDADLGQVALAIAQHKAMLQASYSVFGQLAGLSLVDYLR